MKRHRDLQYDIHFTVIDSAELIILEIKKEGGKKEKGRKKKFKKKNTQGLCDEHGNLKILKDLKC
jgi:hypothetical protein